MLEYWPSIEADFYRDYRIDLRTEIHNMTWRRFDVLLGNLSVESNTVLLMQNDKDEVKKDEPKKEMKRLSHAEFAAMIAAR